MWRLRNSVKFPFVGINLPAAFGPRFQLRQRLSCLSKSIARQPD